MVVGGGGVCGGLAHFGELCSSLSLETSFFLLFICTGSSLYRDQIDLHILAWSTCISIVFSLLNILTHMTTMLRVGSL